MNDPHKSAKALGIIALLVLCATLALFGLQIVDARDARQDRDAARLILGEVAKTHRDMPNVVECMKPGCVCQTCSCCVCGGN